MMMNTLTTQRLFEVSPEKIKSFHAILVLLKQILEDEVIFSIAEEGLHVRQMDKGRFMLVKLRIPSQFFDVFTPTEEITQIQLSIEDLARNVGLWKKEDTLRFEIGETGATILLDHPQFCRTSHLPVSITEEELAPDPTEIMLSYQCRVSRKALAQTITMLAKQYPGENVLFEGQEDALHLTVSEREKGQVSIQHPIDSFGDAHETRVLFPLTYVNKALLNTPVFDDILILELESNKPMRIRYSNTEEVDLMLLLAPIAEASEEEEDEEEEEWGDEEDAEIIQGEEENE